MIAAYIYFTVVCLFLLFLGVYWLKTDLFCAGLLSFIGFLAVLGVLLTIVL